MAIELPVGTYFCGTLGFHAKTSKMPESEQSPPPWGRQQVSTALSSSRPLRVTTVATNPKCFIRGSTIDSANFHAHGLHALYNHWTNQTDIYKHFEILLKRDLKCDRVLRRDLLGLLTEDPLMKHLGFVAAVVTLNGLDEERAVDTC